MTPAPEQSGPQDPQSATLPAPVLRRTAVADLALVTTFGAFIVVCGILPGIPMPGGVPLTLQTFAVVLAGLVLGPRLGLAAAALYLVVGFAGLPVFTGGKSGLGVLSGPTVGYLLGFPVAALAAGLLARRVGRTVTSPVAPADGTLARLWHAVTRLRVLLVAALVASPVLVHPLGIAGMMWRQGLTLREAAVTDIAFVPGDVVKSVLAAVVALAVFRAYPDLLRTRR